VPFWITGESYAGMYIPFLSSLILNNTKANGINFQGIMVGNGVMITDDVFNNNTLLSYLENHNLFSPQILQVLQGVCPNDPESISCQYALQQVNAILKRVNPYDIYGYCTYAQTGSKPFPYFVSFLTTETTEETTVKASNGDDISPCISSAALAAYLNTGTVQTALHINPVKIWEDCSDAIFLNYSRHPDGSIGFYPQFIAAKLKILIYSGDSDSVVSYLNTQIALSQLNLAVTNPWRTWHISNGQVGGYITDYAGLSFTLVRGAGHMVPQSKPEAAYTMFANFITGTSFA
jgi:carboxypeptidase C (cathepsin A)